MSALACAPHLLDLGYPQPALFSVTSSLCCFNYYYSSQASPTYNTLAESGQCMKYLSPLLFGTMFTIVVSCFRVSEVSSRVDVLEFYTLYIIHYYIVIHRQTWNS